MQTNGKDLLFLTGKKKSRIKFYSVWHDLSISRKGEFEKIQILILAPFGGKIIISSLTELLLIMFFNTTI